MRPGVPYGPPAPRPQQVWGNPWAVPAGPRPGPYQRPAGTWGAPPYQPYRPNQGYVYSPNRLRHQRAGGGSAAGCGVGLAIFAVVAVLLLGVPMAFIGLLMTPSSSYSSYSSYTYSSGTTSGYSTTGYSSSATPTPTPTPDPTRSYGSGSYVNDGYERPPVGQGPERPEPQTIPDAEWWRTSNSIYNQQISIPVRCELPPTTEVATDSDEFWEMTDKYLTCMMGAWQQPLANAGYTLTMPTHYVVYGGAVTPCGNTHIGGFAGLYCSAEMGIIYMELEDVWPIRNSDDLITYTYETVLAHEFGHHVQSRTGILAASSWLEWEAPSDEAAYLESRRLELQVQCFAGFFLNAASQSLGLTESDRAALVGRYQNGSQSNTHGSGYHRGAWLNQGLQTTDISYCNTYLADPADLS